MQRIERKNPNVHPLLDEIDRLYAYLSEEPNNTLVHPVWDKSFEPLITEFNHRVADLWSANYVDSEWEKISPIDNNNLILSFSGGKDSIATAIKYRELGYNVYLYHLQHINPSFADEWQCAKEVADILGLPIFIDNIRFIGHHMYMEHPMKNMLIANGALSYGIREGIGTTVAFGNYTTMLLDDNVFERCAGDCMDMWDVYDAIIQRILPDFKVLSILDNLGDTFDTLIDRFDLLNASLSCLCRHSLRDYRRGWVKSKFGIDLFNRRCGSCAKCCMEYIYMTDHDKLGFSEDYYKYCLNQLYKVSIDEGVAVWNVYELWDNFFFYSIRKSKIFNDLQEVKLGGRNLLWQ